MIDLTFLFLFPTMKYIHTTQFSTLQITHKNQKKKVHNTFRSFLKLKLFTAHKEKRNNLGNSPSSLPFLRHIPLKLRRS